MSTKNLFYQEELPYEIEIIAFNLIVPWSIDISKEGKLYVTERIGRIWIMEDGKFLPEPLITLDTPFISQGEGGLMGIALDPNFLTNHYIYIMYTYYEDGKIFNRVARLLEQNNKASINAIILDKIPGGMIHNGGRIKIGPDQKLYVTTGDSGIPNLSQDIKSTAGKILRINLDGSIPEDNPFGDSPVYSLGLRNPQGLTWSTNNTLYATDHGQTAHDEINLIHPGANYGWPIVQGDEESKEKMTIKPLVQSNEQTWAPSGIAFINQGPWQGKLLTACLRGEQLISITLNHEGTEAEKVESWLVNQFGRLREVIQAADGSIYFTTSNRDERNIPRLDDDKILRLVPRNYIKT